MTRATEPPKRRSRRLPVLRPDLQVAFWDRLQAVRGSYLGPALGEAVGRLDIRDLDAELAAHAPPKLLSRIASFRLRGEVFLPVPCLLRVRPCLLGYYRLLYGFSQKEFYTKGPFGAFKPLEERDEVPSAVAEALPALCLSLIASGQMLVEGLGALSLDGVHELQLLTLGPQLRGSQNTRVGRDATAEVFALVKRLVGSYATERGDTRIALANDSGRTMLIEFFSEPDIRITEQHPTGPHPIVSIEIKGGADVSNVHNRLGEAEKSHLKAKASGFHEFWTLLRADVDPARARADSPTTNHFLNLAHIQDAKHPEHAEFRDLFCLRLGIRSPGRRR